MSNISEAKLGIVRSLIEQAPDSAVRTLLSALSADGELDAGLKAVKAIVEAEAIDRRARNAVLDPIAPLCAYSAFSDITFPPRALTQLWKGLKATAEAEVDRAIALVADWRPEDGPPEAFDDLCALAAIGLRAAEQPNFAAAAEAADTGSGAETLAGCLDLAKVTRRALERLPDWLGRMTDEKAANLRLAYRDVVDVTEDGGPKFFEMLAAHLAEPWLILRVISGAMNRPGDSYLASSELSGFGERFLADIDQRLEVISKFNANAGRAAVRSVVEAVQRVTSEIAEFEQSVALSPEGVWGRRIARQKRTLAVTIENHMKTVDEMVAHALPLQTIRLGPRTVRGVPKLSADPDERLVERATTLLLFMHEVRGSAPTGGFASARAKALEVVEQRLDSYVEDILEHLRSGEITDEAHARAYLEVAADFCGYVRDEKASQIMRRRAAAA